MSKLKNTAIFGAGLVLGAPCMAVVAVYVPPVRNVITKRFGITIARMMRKSPTFRRDFRNKLHHLVEMIDILEAKETKK